MAGYTIEKRKTSKGELRYRCTVREHKGEEVVYRESRTFGRQSDAKSWGTQMLAMLERDGLPSKRQPVPTIRELISLYRAHPAISPTIGRTKAYCLDLVADCDIAKLNADELTIKDLVDHCQARKDAGASPATIAHDISYLGTVFAAANPVFNIPVDNKLILEARKTLNNLKLVGKSQKRTRRPVNDELAQIITKLEMRQNRVTAKIPYTDMLDFAILSCMRISEVCKIKWSDVDERNRAVLVEDRKDPRKKIGNHMLVPLLGDAWTILNRQPKTNERIFPYNSRSVTAGFQRVRKELGIEDLRWHDLRREGACRLFEAGFVIDEVAQVTGHRNINILWQIYTNLYPTRVHKKFEKLKMNIQE
ncbi:tyrosine-type recombinase/integrase [Aeromonas jandaei]|uniref:tyrosine-type recombinase/integrase n=1 Tax=Aeromonas jandaei TaxID=650 RepID=UPI003BA2D86C